MLKAFYKCQLIPILLFTLYIAGCNEEDCLSDNVSYLIINFEDSTTNTPVSESFTQVNIVGLEGTLYDNTTQSPFFALPVNPHSDTITFIFRTPDSEEQIAFTYTRKARVLSADCPYEIQYHDLQIVEEKTTFPNYRLHKNELTNNEIPNVTIYR